MTLLTSLEQYPLILAALQQCTESERIARLRYLCLNDLFFLLRYACGRRDVENQWYFDRCREVQAQPDGCLDLWAREHGKSSIITFALTLQNILNNPELTACIFSYSRPLAKAFLRQIKRELEVNELLKRVFDDILWSDPGKQAPKWSEDDGLIIRRKGNPKEGTLEAFGLTDGQPVGRHYALRIYDDIVVAASVTSPDMIQKVNEALALSDNLGTIDGRVRFVGTRYHYSDSYSDLLKREIAKPRIYPATKDGSEDFSAENCALMPPEVLAQKRRTQGPYVFACQMLLRPQGDVTQGFRREWLVFGDRPNRDGLNTYVVVDAANSKKKKSDWTAMWCIGVDRNGHFVVLDVLRDKMNLSERTEALFDMVEKWRPLVVGFETYGMQTDIDHIRHVQEQRNFRFTIKPLGGTVSKEDRIKKLMPQFEQGKIILPRTKMRTLFDKTTVDLVNVFIEEEYCAFPVGSHDDLLDSLARILDPDLNARAPFTTWDTGPVEVIGRPLMRGGRGDSPEANNQTGWRPAWR